MNLWLSGHLLVASFFLSNAALTPEECKPLITPLSLANRSVICGKMYFLAGYTDHVVSKAILNITDSSMVKITESPSSTTDIIMFQENKMKGTCISSRSNVTIEGNTASATHTNMSWSFHLLPSSAGSLVFHINSQIKGVKKLLELLQMAHLTDADEIKTQSLYLVATEMSLKDSDLEHLKKQASCLGFSEEPDFIHDPKKSFCKEGEGILMPYSH